MASSFFRSAEFNFWVTIRRKWKKKKLIFVANLKYNSRALRYATLRYITLCGEGKGK